MHEKNIAAPTKIYETLKNSFWQNKTLELDQRLHNLEALKKAINKNEKDIIDALKNDLGRSNFESYVLEIALIKKELKTAINDLHDWAKLKKQYTPLAFKPGNSYIEPRPRGIVLILAPWNYPFQLSLMPFISAMAAGNTIILKPSEIAKNSSRVIEYIINNFLDNSCYRTINGDKELAKSLLDLKFDHIFFTGSNKVGKEILIKAAQNLIPTTLELGGKSPVIIDETANLKISAKRVLWAKFVNAGQTCIAPDYVLIKRNSFKDFLTIAKKTLSEFIGKDSEESLSYARIINEDHLLRLASYLNDGEVVFGGAYNVRSRFLEPTLMINTPLDSKIMTEEIFGPLLPILPYDNINDVINIINNRCDPLAIYIFSKDKKNISTIKKKCRFGGLAINDCMTQAGINDLPFGGVGQSGMGNYHGIYGFLTFSTLHAIYKKSFYLDNPLRYPPYNKAKLRLARSIMG